MKRWVFAKDLLFFCWAVDAGVIKGMTDTTLSPKTDAVRAQVAMMLMRYEEKVLIELKTYNFQRKVVLFA